MQKQFPLFVSVFIDSLVFSASEDAGGYAISRHNNQPQVAFVLPYLLIELFYIGMPVVRADGRRTVKWLPKFPGWVDYHIFLGMGYARA